jgi:hypothetical protein
MDRRARRTDDVALMFGRLDGESEDDYKARLMPMISAGLLMPRLRAEENRKTAEDKAHVTPEQSAKLDKAFDKIYSDVIDYTNKSVADGQLSPYERNVAGWLEYAGGLGGILNDANGQIAKVLEPSQVKAMSDAGFEWGEYLGLKAPWEQLKPPPGQTALSLAEKAHGHVRRGATGAIGAITPSPSWPARPSPQHFRVPSASRAQVCWSPAVRSTTPDSPVTGCGTRWLS